MPFSLPIPIDMTWAAVAAPHPLPCPFQNIDNIYVFPFSLIASFCFSFIQMNNITRTRTRGKEGVFGGELARRFVVISLVLVSPEHMKSTPRTSWFSGCLYLPLSYLIRILRFVLFGIIEFGRIYSLTRTRW